MVYGISWLTDTDVGLTIQVYLKMLEYGGEQHVLGMDTIGRGQEISYMLNCKESSVSLPPTKNEIY